VGNLKGTTLFWSGQEGYGDAAENARKKGVLGDTGEKEEGVWTGEGSSSLLGSVPGGTREDPPYEVRKLTLPEMKGEWAQPGGPVGGGGKRKNHPKK